MAVVCFPYLSGKVKMEDGTLVDEPDDNAGKYLKFEYILIFNITFLQYNYEIK